MIDVRAFKIERERLRRFCFQETAAVVVIRDLAGSGLEDPRSSPAIRIAEWLVFCLTIDADRFADPDDGCDDFTPSVFAMPSKPCSKQDVAAMLDDECPGPMPFIVDYRLGELMWPLFAPHLVTDTLREIKLWDRGLHQRQRVGGLVTSDVRADSIAIGFDGGPLLARAGRRTFDIGAHFWRAMQSEISSQRCMRRDAWQRSAFNTEGNA